MEHSFWHERWEANQLGFHRDSANPLLVDHLADLALGPGARVFLPLCGKTLDIGWLMEQGHAVAGAELSEIAIRDLFSDLEITPEVRTVGPFARWSAPGIDVFVGDIFDLTTEILGPVDAVYDRAALVALPPEMRTRYAAHLRSLTQHARQLLITFAYDQSVMDGPPFSVVPEEVRKHYEAAFDIAKLSTRPIAGGLKGYCPADATAWHLRKLTR